MNKKNQKFFSKSYSEKEEIFTKLRQTSSNWKKENQSLNKPFFAIHSDFKSFFLKEISGGALKLYIYLGFHAKYHTGELWHSAEEISNFFEKDQRTIGLWFKELEDRGLIFREQKGYKMKANTFLRPYGLNFKNNYEKSSLKLITNDIQENIKLDNEPLNFLLLNYAYTEYIFVIFYKKKESKEKTIEVSIFFNFEENMLEHLKEILNEINFKIFNFDIESSITGSANPTLSTYNYILKYFEETDFYKNN